MLTTSFGFTRQSSCAKKPNSTLRPSYLSTPKVYVYTVGIEHLRRAAILAVRGEIGEVVVAEPNVNHQLWVHTPVVLREETELNAAPVVLVYAEGVSDSAGHVRQ